MNVKPNELTKYRLDQPCLPMNFCNGKNAILLIGQICSKFTEETDGMTTFELRILQGDVTVRVTAEQNLLAAASFDLGGPLIIEGEFKTYYRKLRMYRPLIQVLAHKIDVLTASEPFEPPNPGFYPNRVFIRGVVAENPMKYMTPEGEVSFKLSVLSQGAEIPCTIPLHVMEEIGLDTIIKDERYLLWGTITIRLYQKRLGKGMILQTDSMNEVRNFRVGKQDAGDLEID